MVEPPVVGLDPAEGGDKLPVDTAAGLGMLLLRGRGLVGNKYSDGDVRRFGKPGGGWIECRDGPVGARYAEELPSGRYTGSMGYPNS